MCYGTVFFFSILEVTVWRSPQERNLYQPFYNLITNFKVMCHIKKNQSQKRIWQPNLNILKYFFTLCSKRTWKTIVDCWGCFFYYFIKVLVEVSKIQLFYKCTYRDCTASAMEAAMLDDIASFWRFLKKRLQPHFSFPQK